MEKEYRKILFNCIRYGTMRKDRTGVGSKSLFSQSLEYDLHSSGLFPFITGKKLFFKNVEAEFKWFINGETNIKRFKEHGSSIWDKWADENGELGPVYGYQMLNFNSQGINQLNDVILSLKLNPDSRRHIITLWNPNQLHQMKLPPCYLYFQFFIETGNLLNLQVIQRSADLFVGVPYDFALFSLFLMYVANETKTIPSTIKLLMVDAHVYNTHIEQANKYLDLPIYRFPKLYYFNKDNFFITNYNHGPFLKVDVAI